MKNKLEMEEKKEKKITANEVMTRNVLGVPLSSTVQKVAILMKTEKIGSVIVFQDRKPVGIVTDNDITIKFAADPPYSTETKVTALMSSPVICVSPEQPIGDVIKLMTKNSIRKIPVVENGKACGIVTTANLLRLFSRSTSEEMKEMFPLFGLF